MWYGCTRQTGSDGFISDLQKAQTVAELNKLLEQAKNEIDAIIDQIPETGAWDGVTKTEPKAVENGVYQITSGDELAGFADQVKARKRKPECRAL